MRDREPCPYSEALRERPVTHRYVDPLDQIWLEAARGVGLRVERNRDVFAATDGKGTLWLAPPEALDADDCLAQMIFHELCHSLVMGAKSFERPDWGLDNETDQHRSLEHACLRVQAALLEPLGLRRVFAPTTEYRAFYDSLGTDPLAPVAGTEDDESPIRARVALQRSERAPWAPHLQRALEASARVIHAVHAAVYAGQTSDVEAPPSDVISSLYARVAPRALPHPSGWHANAVADRTCGECGWFALQRGRAWGKCRQLGEARVEATWPSCERFEGPLDCLTCGACCREAYDVVAVSLRDPALQHHRKLMVVYEGRAEMRREHGRCVALRGGQPLTVPLPGQDPERPEPPLYQPGGAPFTCAIYEERPRTCRDFARGGEHCLTARRRVGLSR